MPTQLGQGNFETGRQAFQNGDYFPAFRNLEPAARGGNPDAQYAVGYMYYYGLGTVQDRGLALQWMTSAANQGQPQAREALIEIREHEYKGIQPFPGNNQGTNFVTQPRTRGTIGPVRQNIPVEPAPDQNAATRMRATWPPAKGEQYQDTAEPAPSAESPNSSMMEPPINGGGGNDPSLITQEGTQSYNSYEDLPKYDVKVAGNESTEAMTKIVSYSDETENGAGLEAYAHVSDPIAEPHGIYAEAPELIAEPRSFSHGPEPIARSHTTYAEAVQPKESIQPKESLHAKDKIMESTVYAEAESYTVQIIASYNRHSLEKFAKDNHLTEMVSTYSVKRGDKNWYVLGYGHYKSKKEAENAAKQLPKNLQQANPWVRTMAGLNTTGLENIG